MSQNSEILSKRDLKARPVLEQFAPVWLVDETLITGDEAVLFEVVFQHNLYGWVKRRYRYDAFNNVLYYKGQTAVPEVDMAAIEEKEPYISAILTDMPNASGG